MVTPTLKRISPEESEKLICLAEEIWLPAFAPYFDRTQLIALFKGMYHPDLIKAQLADPARTYHFIFCNTENEKPDGYCAVVKEKTSMRIDKVYVRKALRGQGTGTAVIRQLLSCAAASGMTEASLRVNRQNTAAVRLYLRLGFTIACEEDFPAPDGYVYKDYVMVKRLEHRESP